MYGVKNMSREELLKGLSEEQIAKVNACKTQEELLALAKEEGLELNDEQLAAVSGGCGDVEGQSCPDCGSNDIKISPFYNYSNDPRREFKYFCKNCGKYFN